MKKHILLSCAALMLALCTACVHDGTASDTVKASSFGFNAEDATECLQKAIDSGARTVIVDNVGKPWNVRPLKLRSNLTLKFEDNVLVIAKKGEFKGKGDCLFKAAHCDNLKLIGGKNSVLKMRKKDYLDPKQYVPAEWRTILALNGCHNVVVKNLTLASSGGDGIYISAGNWTRPFAKNILIENCIIDDNHRQGISVISVNGLTIRKCVISNTFGTEPQAGIDCEVNSRAEYQQNILVEDTVFRGNFGGGFVWASVSVHPVSVVIRNCTFDKDYLAAIVICRGGDVPTKGTFKVENCTINTLIGNYPSWYAQGRPCTTIPFYFMGVGSGLFDVDISNVTINAPDIPLKRRISPFSFRVGSNKEKNNIGNVNVKNVKVRGFKDVPIIHFDNWTNHITLKNIYGKVDFNGKQVDLASTVKELGFDKVKPRKSYPAAKSKVASLKQPAVFPKKSAATTINPEIAAVIGENEQLDRKGLQRPELRSNFKLFFLGKKGMKTTFRCNIFYSMYERWPMKAFLTDGKGSTINLGAFKKGINEFSFTWPKDGIYMLHFISRGSRMKVIGGENLFISYGQSSRAGGTGMIYLPKRYTGYFAVPANVRNFSLSAQGNPLEQTSFELRDASGKVVFSKDNFEFPEVVKATKKSNKREIWSFTFSDSVEDVIISFHKPLSGVWAEDPACLPDQK